MDTPMILWQLLQEHVEHGCLEGQGVFSSPEAAMTHCVNDESFPADLSWIQMRSVEPEVVYHGTSHSEEATWYLVPTYLDNPWFRMENER